MKGFSNVSRAATCASGVILESCSPESVVAKRRDSVQKPYGMTTKPQVSARLIIFTRQQPDLPL